MSLARQLILSRDGPCGVSLPVARFIKASVTPSVSRCTYWTCYSPSCTFFTSCPVLLLFRPWAMWSSVCSVYVWLCMYVCVCSYVQKCIVEVKVESNFFLFACTLLLCLTWFRFLLSLSPSLSTQSLACQDKWLIAWCEGSNSSTSNSHQLNFICVLLIPPVVVYQCLL